MFIRPYRQRQAVTIDAVAGVVRIMRVAGVAVPSAAGPRVIAHAWIFGGAVRMTVSVGADFGCLVVRRFSDHSPLGGDFDVLFAVKVQGGEGAVTVDRVIVAIGAGIVPNPIFADQALVAVGAHLLLGGGDIGATFVTAVAIKIENI